MMPFYYFKIHQTDGTVADDTIGTELQDVAHARIEATQALADMALDAMAQPGTSNIEIHVRDGKGREVAVRKARFTAEDFES